MGIHIGLDIGVASVGWAVLSVEDEVKILESGSNLFECADASKNVERRSFRQSKRLSRRRKTRINDFKKLWERNGFSIPRDVPNNQLELRVNGLEEELSIDEIYHVLLTMLKHRGISYLDDVEEMSVGQSDYKRGLSVNLNELSTGKYPCQIQMDKLMKYGKYRGHISVVEKDEKITLSNIYTTSAYRQEVSAFLNMQKAFHVELTNDFIDEYLTIFNRKRKYYEGPGNELSRTDYGKYSTKKDVNGEYITEPNIFEKLIGKCSVYTDELRAAGASYTAQEFNLLNDLCNLKVNGEPLTEEQKKKIVETIKKSNVVKMRNIIKKVIGEEIRTFEGARIDKSEKEIFHSFENYRKMKKLFADQAQADIDTYSREFLDELGYILTINTDKEAILEAFNNAFDGEGMFFSDDATVDEQLKNAIIDYRKKNGTLFSKWQSFGLTIMKKMIPTMYTEPKNQMQILTEMGVFKSRNDKFKESKYIPKDLITSEIYNPVVVRSIRVTVDILNALIKKYGYPEAIVIEMPRDRNSEEEKKRIVNNQKKNEKELGNIKKKIKDQYGISITDQHFHGHKNLTMKLKLWNEQGGVCLYSGKTIEIQDLLNDPQKFEIDHIIPKSVSFDDSRSNKVLVYEEENQEKGNRTPYGYLNGISREYDFHELMSRALTMKKILGEKKVNNLLYTGDITKVDVLKGFINRNINDTRYASRVILNFLQDYFNSKGCDTKIKVVRGSFTSQMRKQLRLEKNRDESYAHHAVDAMIICFAQMGYAAYEVLMKQAVDFENDEITDKDLREKIFINRYYDETILHSGNLYRIRGLISQAEKKVKYWHKVDKKINRELCNKNVRGTREYDGKIYQIKKLNIYYQDDYLKFKKKISDGKETQFLAYRNDPKTWSDIMSVYEQYKDASNAFVAYENETGDYLRKYSKKHNGPRITNLKYTDCIVNSCIDVSHKYGFEKGSKKVILDSLNPYRTDIWYNKLQQHYYLVGVKYADLNYDGTINEYAYNNTLIAERVLKDGQSLKDVEKIGLVFIDSLYKNDIIQYERNGEYFTERFLSRTKPNQMNYIETKPIDRAKYEKRHQVGLNNTKMIKKINTDILGNYYFPHEK